MVGKHEHDMARLEHVFLRLLMNLKSNDIRVVQLLCRRKLQRIQKDLAGSGGFGV